MERGMVFNIQKYSIHDGGGIRTIVFLKGCPLFCPWCSNPESHKFEPEVMRKEPPCIQCISSSPFDCSRDPKDCPTEALECVGREMTVEEVVEEVKKDAVFYDASKGGVTLSGGEPLAQGKFSLSLLKELKRLCFDTALETSGQGKWSILEKMSAYLDRVLFDVKLFDKRQAQEVLGADLELIISNFKRLLKKDVEVIPRFPLIPGYTMTDENIELVIEFLKEMEREEIHLLPFHQYGSSKYQKLGEKYKLKDLSPPADGEVEAVKEKMLEAGFKKVIIGGR